LFEPAHQALGDPFKVDSPPCPSLESVVSNEGEAMDSHLPVHEAELDVEPAMGGSSVSKLSRIELGEEVCFGMVGNLMCSNIKS
jgi:hypothetical protein